MGIIIGIISNRDLLLIAGLFFLCLTAKVTANVGDSQAQLLADLFTDYTPDVRPVCDVTEPIEVQVDLAVRQIIELDEPKQILYLNTWIRLSWYDCSLVWNASNYSDISNLVVPFEKVWSPDITLYDNGDSELEGSKEYLISVYSSGMCYYNYPTIIKVLCKIDVTYFPFDTQSCPLKFGSWSYHGLELNITNKNNEGDITSFLSNVEWDLLSVPNQRNVVYYGCCPEPYPDVTFYVTMKRKPLFYVLNLLFPCLLITSVALLGFMLPPDAGEKVSLEITVLLSLAVFLLVVSETLPATSDGFPFIGIYFAMAMMLVSMSTLLTVLVLNIHHKGELNKPVPNWIRKFVLNFLGKLVCVQSERSVYPLGSRSQLSGEDNKSFRQETYINGYQEPFWVYNDDIDEIVKEFHNKEHANCNGHSATGSAKSQTGWGMFQNNTHPRTDTAASDRSGGRAGITSVGGSAHRSTASAVGGRSVRGGSSAGGGRAPSDMAFSMDSDSPEQSNPTIKVLRQQLYLLERNQARHDSKLQHDHISSEWKKVAIVLDRVFALIYIFIMTVSSLAILLQLNG